MWPMPRSTRPRSIGLSTGALQEGENLPLGQRGAGGDAGGRNRDPPEPDRPQPGRSRAGSRGDRLPGGHESRLPGHPPQERCRRRGPGSGGQERSHRRLPGHPAQLPGLQGGCHDRRRRSFRDGQDGHGDDHRGPPGSRPSAPSSCSAWGGSTWRS